MRKQILPEHYYIQKDKIRKRLVKYTRKAFQIIPEIKEPYILDIGCGSGVPTMELAKLSNGRIYAIDIDQPALERLKINIEKTGLASRIKVERLSILNMNFPEATFDIIWSEGSIYTVGFEKGIKEWIVFIKPGGFLVIHDQYENLKEKQKLITQYGYELTKYFILDEHVWQNEYFIPLVELMDKMQKKYAWLPELELVLESDRREIGEFRLHPEQNRSIYYVMKKKDDFLICKG